MKPRGFRLLTAAVCTVFLLLGGYAPGTEHADAAVQTVHNLVLFAQFQGEDGYNFMEAHTAEMLDYCRKENTFRSLAGYINEISYGQMQVDFVFPQLEGDTILPYTMSGELDSYHNLETMAAEVISHVPVPRDSRLDGNGDGLVDNIILVMDADTETAESLFWPRAFSLPGIGINDAQSGMVNIQNSATLFGSSIMGGVGVLGHEFLHSVGYPDLYRNDDRTGIPVGMWDIMASNSIFVQYPLAYMRYSVSGWLDAKTVTQDGTYTLEPASARSGNRLYLLKTPLSDTEFFAVEFRQKGTPYSEEMDVKIYGTGMVVYRVNTEIHGNHGASGDQIYVFRPEETGLDAGEGNPYLSAYGGEGAPDSIGSLDPTATITDGALVYSDGTNSGIRLSDIRIDGDQLHFTARFQDTTDRDLWRSMPEADWMTGASALDLQASDSGVLYMLTGGTDGAILSRLQDNTWEQVSRLPEQAYDPKLCMRGEIPYVLYQDGKNFSYVIQSYQDGTWQQLTRGSELSQYQDFTIWGDRLYLAYTTGSFPYGLHVSAYDLNTGEKTDYEDGAGDVCNLSIGADDTSVAVAYRGAVNSTAPAVDVWDAQGHRTISLSDQSAGRTDLIRGQEGYYISATEQAAGLYALQNGETEHALLGNAVSGNCYYTELTRTADGLYLTISTQNPSDLAVYQYRDGGFAKLGNSIAGETVGAAATAAAGDMLYVAYCSEQGNVRIKTYRLRQDSVTGDVNGDGACTVADAVLLGRWLRREQVSLANWRAGDLDGSGMLSGADLTMLRRMLTGT